MRSASDDPQELNVLRTTAEHPFWVEGKGWTAVKDLEPGDLLRGHDGQLWPVESVTATTELAPVYNCRIAEYHTYFVQAPAGGAWLWAHNWCKGVHHYWPKSMGSLVKSGSATGAKILGKVPLSKAAHARLHRALNAHLKPLGMLATRGRDTRVIVRAFTPHERLRALVQFYKNFDGGKHLPRFRDEVRLTWKAGLYH
ncbi:MAG TPA: polymorphic toxin-type HINT domain-containing protein [Gemmatales bacterium]|nr:polymorphic toxin-type HINT domain-containing protein [Gemmatales bacterium]